MAVKCHVCYAWQPKEWNGWKWEDTAAFCSLKGRFVTHNESCEYGSLTGDRLQQNIISKPVAKQRVPVRQAKPDSGGGSAHVIASDADRPALYSHQHEDFERYKEESEIALFWEMGCVDGSTEYFNGVEWKRIDQYQVGDKVLQFNLDGTAELVEPLKYYKYPVHDDMVHFKTARGMDQVLSLGHRILPVDRYHYDIKPVMTVEELLSNPTQAQNYLCPIAFNGYIDRNTALWDLNEWQTRLMIAVIATGHFARQTNLCRIKLKKQHKADRLIYLLDMCGISYKTNHTLERDGYYRFYFYAPVCEKQFNSHWYNAPVDWVISEVLKWNGNEEQGRFSSTSKLSADFVQFTFASIGCHTSMQTVDRSNEGKSIIYTVVISDQKPYTAWFSFYTQDGYPQKYVTDFKYCFEVPSSFLVLRRNNGIFITGNTGKSATILAIAGYQFKHKKIDALLVIAPNEVHLQWARQQIPLWLDVPYDIQCLFGKGGAKVTRPFDDDPELLQVVCVNVDTFSTPNKWREITEWANSRQTFVVLDEATAIKNVSAQRTQRILYEFNDTIRKGNTVLKTTIKSKARAVLTGTPVTNGAMDLWAICEFVRPNFFGRNWYSFKNHYGMFTHMAVNEREIAIPLTQDTWSSIKAMTDFTEAAAVFGVTQDTFLTIHSQDAYQGPYKHADELREMLKPIASFRLLTDTVDMPERIYNTRELMMSDAQQKCYDDMVNEYIAEYDEHTMTALNKITVVIRLQQISSGFIYDKSFENDELLEDMQDRIAKLYGLTDETDITPDDHVKWIGNSNPKLDALYRDIEEVAKPAVIITRFSAEAARIYNDLASKHSVCLMTGWKRIGTIEEFQNGKYDIMVANSGVVDRGFNLQNSHVIMFYSNTFSLETRLQTEGRIFRLGQKHPCQYIDYMYTDTVDTTIVAALKLKRNLLDYIRGADIRELV